MVIDIKSDIFTEIALQKALQRIFNLHQRSVLLTTAQQNAELTTNSCLYTVELLVMGMV